jgi:hypothetical protein
MAIIRVHTGPDGQSHFEDVEPRSSRAATDPRPRS